MSNRLLADRRQYVEPPADVARPDAQNLVTAELRISHDIYSVLERHYPGHRWAVGADLRGEVAYLSIPALMGPLDKWVLHLENIMDPLQLSIAVMKAGGEILERFRIPRASLEAGLGEFLDAKDTKRIGLNGNTEMPA
jgi:hypothetical protein